MKGSSYVMPVFVALALVGCAGEVAHQQGIDLFAAGKQEEGLAKLKQAAREAPENQVYLLAYRNALARIVSRLLGEAQAAKQAGRYDAAEADYRHVLRLDSSNAEATAALAAIDRQRAQATMLQDAQRLIDAGTLDPAQRIVDDVLRDEPRQPAARALQQVILQRREHAQAPELRASFQKPVTLEFRDANLRQVLEALAAHSGLNFILDRDVPPTLTVSVFLRNVTVAQALDLILSTHQLRRRILNETSVLIYPDTAAKLTENQDLVVRNFFLANAEAKAVANMLKTVLRARSVYADDKLNLVVMRDTPDTIALAERLVATQDVGEPEVMLELAVMEVTRSRLTNIGLVLPSQLSLTPLPMNPSATTLTLTDLKNLNSDRLAATLSPTIINLQDDSNGENLLANPRIRTHSREKALIRIGDRVPVITTTATSTGFVSENVQYLDVGLKLEVEPIVFPNDEIGIKLGLEVSNVVAQITSKAGTVAYQVGSRNAGTVLRLKDGETQVLGGLINDDDIRSANRFPGLSKLPVLGRLFSNERKNNQKTELVLTITPRIVRSLMPPSTVPATFWSGTEASPGLRRAVETVDTPASAAHVLTLPGGSAGGGAPGTQVPGAPLGAPVPRPGSEVQPDQPPAPGAAGAPPAVAMPVVPAPAPAPAPAAAAPAPPPAAPPAATPESQPAPVAPAPEFGPALLTPAAPAAPLTPTPMPAPPLAPSQQ
jgi:general secretion pathway protein D